MVQHALEFMGGMNVPKLPAASDAPCRADHGKAHVGAWWRAAVGSGGLTEKG